MYLCKVFRGLKLSILAVILIITSCNKDDRSDEYNVIPNVGVDIHLNLNEPSNYNLTFEGGWIYVPGGSRGIIVYRTLDQYMAYERHTPYQSDRPCAVVEVDSNNVYAVDGCSGTQYLLLDGSVASGPATLPLLRYKTSVFSDVLNITN